MEGPSATWRWPDETADEWERGKGRHVLASVRGACRHGRRHVGNIVASVRLGCRHTRGATSGPPVGSCEQQRHSRSDDDHQATGERRAGQPPGGSDRGPRRHAGVALKQLLIDSGVGRYFDVDSSALTDRAKQVLDEIVKRWNGKPPATVTVVGHTDSVADDAHNQTLSEQRAKAVADYLTSKVPSLKVQSSGKGESEPVASETNADGSVNEAGKAANRHVDVRWG